MHRFIFHSNKVSFIIEIVILCYFLIGCGTQGHTEPTLLSKEGYLVSISDYATEEDTRWAKYLYDHLKKRAEDEDMIAFGVSEKDMFRIIVQIDPALKNDFKVETHANGIKLITSGPKKMLWLQYQIMKKIGDMDKRIESSDLPPALVNLNDTCGSFAFKYQSIYSPTGLHPDYPGITGLDNFDESWGIWGHNLGKVLGKDLDEFYATIDKKKYEEMLARKPLYEDILQTLKEHISDKVYKEPESFIKYLSGILSCDKKLTERIADGLSEMDKTAEIQRDKKGNIIYDKETRDTEIVKYTEDIETYMAREVLPYVPDAKWFWEENLGAKKPVIKIGAEIPFTRYFYKYTQPEKSEVLEEKFLTLEKSVNERIKALFAVKGEE